MKKGLRILILTVLASLFLLTTTAFAVSANSTANTDFMKTLHIKNPLATTARSVGSLPTSRASVSQSARARARRPLT